MLKIKYLDKYSSSGLSDFIQKSILLFEKRYSVFLTIHAMSGRWYNRSGSYLFSERTYHRAGYCRKNRYTCKSYNRHCMKDCAAGVEQECLKTGMPFLHSCWKGVKELIVPFMLDRNPELIFYIGPFQGEKPPEQMKKEWEKLPSMPEEKIAEMILDVQIMGFAFYARLTEKEHRDISQISNRREAIREYILRNGCGTISLKDLAKHLGLSPSRTSHLCVLLLGVPFQDLVTNIRMKKAEILLTKTDEPIKEISSKCGFSDIFYFSKMFRRFYGLPPGAMRKNRRKNTVIP